MFVRRSTFRSVLIAFVCIMGALPAVRAEGAPDPVEAAADKILATGPDEALDLSPFAHNKLDQWLVCYELLRRGESEAAARLAAASDAPTYKLLAAHLETVLDGSGETIAELLALRKVPASDWNETRLRRLAELQLDGDPFLEALRERLRADVSAARKDYAAAMRAYGVSGEAADECGWLTGSIRAHGVGAMMAQRVPDYARNHACYVALRAAYQRAGMAVQVAEATGYIANALAQMGEFRGALAHYRVALSGLRQGASQRMYALTLRNYGLAQRYAGQYASAILALEQALDATRDHGRQAHVKLILGETLRLLGDLEQAEELTEAALRTYEKHDMRRSLPDGMAALGVLRRLQGEFDEAEQLLKGARVMYAAAGHTSKVLRADNALAVVARDRGDLEGALKQLKSIRDRTVASSDSGFAQDQLDDLGELATRMGRWGEARDWTREVLEDLADGPPTRLRIIAKERMARVHDQGGDLKAGWEVAASALQDARDLLAGLGSGDVSSSRAARSRSYATALRLAMKRNRAVDALSVLESARIGARRTDVSHAGGISEALLSRETGLRIAEAAARSHYQHLVRKRAGRKARGAARREWSAAQDALRKIIGRIQRESLAGRALFPRESSAVEIQSVLGAGEALVLYGLLGDTGYATVTTKDQVRIVTLGKVERLEAIVESFDGTDDGTDPAPLLAQVRAFAVDPLKLPPTITRVLVSPDGALFHIPFTTLLPKREIVYVVSGSAYHDIASAKIARGQEVLALGHPVYDKERSNLHHLQGGISAERSAKRQRAGELSPLPATEGEVKTVGDRVLLQAKSTEAGLRELLKTQKRWRAVHLACHGIVDEDKPLFSSLALTQDGDDDGFLHAHEINAMGFNADLVVLSACETARGRFYKAFGVRGLTRSFLDAGASSVIVSLWKVPDEATGVLMRKFHELWNPRDGKTKPISAAAALKQAQEFVRSQQKWKHPYNWAAWQVWGHGR